jgi:hypothetical protein
MDNTPEILEEEAKRAKNIQTMRTIWMILIVVFAVIAVWRIYDWSLGQDNLRGVLSPFGMIFLGTGAIIRPRNARLSYVFTGIAMILVFTSLILLLIY